MTKKSISIFIGNDVNANWPKRTPDRMADLKYRHVPAGVAIVKDWDPDLHPRGADGKFGEGGGAEREPNKLLSTMWNGKPVPAGSDDAFPTYKINDAAGLPQKFLTVAVAVKGDNNGAIIACPGYIDHETMLQYAGYHDVDNWVRMRADEHGGYELVNLYAGVAFNNMASNEEQEANQQRAIENVYHAADIMREAGLSEDTPLAIMQNNGQVIRTSFAKMLDDFDLLKEDWDEGFHPRDEHGHFINSGGGRSGEKTPAQRRAAAAGKEKSLGQMQLEYEDKQKAISDKTSATADALLARRNDWISERDALGKRAGQDQTKVDLLQDEKYRLIDQRNALSGFPESKAFAALSAKIDETDVAARAALDDMNAARAEQETIRNEFIADSRALVSVDNPADILDTLVLNTADISGQHSEDINKAVTSGFQQINNLVDQSILDAIPVGEGHTIPTVMPRGTANYDVTERYRANFDPANDTLNIAANSLALAGAITDQSAHDNANTVLAHEYGHYLEYRVPGAQAAMDELYNRRTEGNPTIKMNAAYGGGNSYRSDEETKIDKWMDAYMGKVYSDGATELLSMGLEYMYKDPGALVRSDPELFGTVYGILRGSTLP